MPLTRQQVIADLVDVLFADPGELTDDTELVDVGLDSLRLATLIDRWRTAGARISFADLAEKPVLGAWFEKLGV
ncbi:phosphopantetheine-binding protein [Nocardia sp. NBC_01377]|uniref:phosphopantetheine-binding protein n=1 Tax=Nocardia sp. NBC_01377 TaxID=2903595 RepID=UPI003245321E